MSDTSTALALIPPRLQEQGVEMLIRENGYRSLGIPDQVRANYNVIFPTVELSQSNPDFTPMLREIRLNPDADAYTGATFHAKDELSLGKNGLLKLAEAAKVDIDTERIPHASLNPETERLGWKAIATQRHSDGTLTRQTGSATFDNEAQRAEIEEQVRSAKLYENGARTNKPKFPAGSAEYTAEVEKRWRVKTNKASELTETIAIERALRAILKLPQKMKKTEFAKPWLVMCYGFLPQSPEARAEAARAMARLYGGPVDEAPRALDTRAGASSPPALDTGAANFEDEPIVLDAVEEAEVEESAAAAASQGEAGAETEAQSAAVDEPAGPTVEELAEAAGSVKPPVSGMQDFTLAQISQKPDGVKWFEWALTKDFSRYDPTFNGELRAFCVVYFPALLAEEAAQ